MRQWHQGKEGFMKVTRIQDKYNPDKVWMIKRYLCGTFYVNQEIKQDMRRKADIAFREMESEMLKVIKQDEKSAAQLKEILAKAKERMMEDD